MRTKYLAARLLLAAMTVTVPTVLAQPASPGSGGQAVADVHHLSNRLRDVIKNVEKSDLPCVTRNNIVRRLRLVDDALLTQNRSAAAGLLAAWIAQARSMEGAGLLSAPQGAMLQVPLGDILPQIGVGSVKNPLPTVRWPPLPACDATRGAGSPGALSEYEIWTPGDARVIAMTAVGLVPVVGKLLSPLVAIFWPASGPDVSSIIGSALQLTLQADLQGLKSGVKTFEQYESAWHADCQTYGVSSSQCTSGATWIASQWGALNLDLQQREARFRMQGYEVELLPFYAQFMNVYLAFLREGALLVQGWPNQASALGQIPENTIKAVLDPANTSRFLGYVNATYKMGLDQQPSPDDRANWATRNQYIRNNTLGVLDFREMWPYMDPAAYPNGFPGFKLTRMIYSDPIGGGDVASTPAYADGPLQHLTFWTIPGEIRWQFFKALQFTGGPTSGPQVVSPRMGASVPSGSTQHDFDVRPGTNYPGPIVSAQGYSYKVGPFAGHWLAQLTLNFANGYHPTFDSGFYWPEMDGGQGYYFQYDDEVVASMSVGFEAYAGVEWAEHIIFGFRYADSFYPSGEAFNAGTGGCMAAPYPVPGFPVMDMPCGFTLGQFWTYYSPFREFRVWGGTQCLTAPSTAVGSQLTTSDCAHGSNQQWTVNPGAGGGTIAGVQSGLFAGSSGSGGQIQLQTNTGALTQKWRTFSKVQGPVHAQGAGKCLGVTSLSNGTPVQIYTCNGLTPTQTWVYSPSLQTFSFPGWTQCLTARGTAAGSLVEMKVCTGEASQQWREDATGAITHLQSGLVLDVLGGKTVDGSPVGLATWVGGVNQRWTWPMN